MAKLPIKFIRGGTSKAVYLRKDSLHPRIDSNQEILLKLMGSPDPTQKQLDGLGGGTSSLSKVAILSKRQIEGKGYLSYLFGQVSIDKSEIDWSGSCGNIAAGLIEYVKGETEFEDCFETNLEESTKSRFPQKLRVWQENKKHEIIVWGNINSIVDPSLRIEISGVPNKYDPIYVEFKNILKNGQLLFPSHNLIDEVTLSCGKQIKVTFMQGTNPIVFVKANDIELEGTEIPKNIKYDLISSKIDELRKLASKIMKIELKDSLRVCWIASPKSYHDNSQNLIHCESINILSRMSAPGSVGIHNTHTGTGAINLAIAASVEGTLVNQVSTRITNNNEIKIGHPGGIMACEALVKKDGENYKVIKGGFVRNARLILEGNAYI